MIIKYEIVCSEYTLFDLERKVEDFCKRGYKLHGTPFVFKKGFIFRKTCYCQAMIYQG